MSAAEEHFRTLLAALGVLSTVITIAVALFLQWGLVRLKRPSLSLTVSQDLRDEDWVCLDFVDRIELYLRLRVHNEPKKDTAHNTEILLLKVQRPSHGQLAPVVPSRQLAWADTPDERLAIPSGTWRRVDVLKLTHNLAGDFDSALVPALKAYELRRKSGGPAGITRVWAFLSRGRNKQRHVDRRRQYATERDVLRDDGAYEFELAITADEIEASRWSLSFVYVQAEANTAEELLPQLSQVQLLRL